MIGRNWTCPYCTHAQTITKDRYYAGVQQLYVKGSAYGDQGVVIEATVCANAQCKELVLSVGIGSRGLASPGPTGIKDITRTWRLLPQSSAKPQPDYIPKPVRDDYNEACAIRDLTPKASATLARRCHGDDRPDCPIIDELAATGSKGGGRA